MVAPHPKRASIVDLHRSGLPTKDIAKILSVPLRTVRRAVQLFRSTGGTIYRPRSGRPVTATTKNNVKKIQKRIQRNSRRSMRKMAKEIVISERSTRRIVKNKLKITSYKIYKPAGLTDKNKIMRLKRCRELLKRANGRHHPFVFSDEKIFTAEVVVNYQNDRILSKDRKTANSIGGIVSRSAHPASVMVFGCITSDGKCPLVDSFPCCLHLCVRANGNRIKFDC